MSEYLRERMLDLQVLGYNVRATVRYPGIGDFDWLAPNQWNYISAGGMPLSLFDHTRVGDDVVERAEEHVGMPSHVFFNHVMPARRGVAMNVPAIAAAIARAFNGMDLQHNPPANANPGGRRAAAGEYVVFIEN
jgi:hypothetical protein